MRKLVLLSGLFLVLLAACKKDKDYDASPQLKADVATIKAYIDTHHLVATLDTATGIYYNVTVPGNGVDSVKYFGTTVNVLYTGRLMADSTVFDSTGTTPRTFTYSGLIGGWQFGLTKITKGGKITLYLPSYWAYGRQAQPGIPANSILIFDIEMTDLKNPL
ncbi:peptidylprolyl isomerase/FKBP-type peptidyl-prolyl cis-trans isomerase FkpA [Chitinophaga sp. YR573]|uniref:FKBP-type peptidyl-prolyl cis-trans isomerase n=1 Tax=Chitinophaga sp. YR573 TaxID=1881040 RepID=UPI0008D8A85F|nr:FKBP-type peptidyl-prolyl cis-trans isomerase [Chitinophaga sp. YR573]SEV90530.1 peptidylprolyl isomerase/FKBP-type peptidyl-prolyl cis-trans isomerase FkpA [Chitinophaga sp. YR573]